MGAPALDASGEMLSWRFSIADVGGIWSWSGIADEKLRYVVRKLALYESKTWAQMDRQHHKRIEVAEVCSEAQKRLRTIKQDDVDFLYEIRLSGPERVWGILHGSVFYLLWWDPAHTVYPSKRR